MVTLPLKLTLKSLRRTATAVEVDCNIVDAEGVSVQFLPLHLNAKAAPAEVVAVLQSVVADMASKMYRRKEAVLEVEKTPPTEEDFAKLVGQDFYGSVST